MRRSGTRATSSAAAAGRPARGERGASGGAEPARVDKASGTVRCSAGRPLCRQGVQLQPQFCQPTIEVAKQTTDWQKAAELTSISAWRAEDDVTRTARRVGMQGEVRSGRRSRLGAAHGERWRRSAIE